MKQEREKQTSEQVTAPAERTNVDAYEIVDMD
jgi:hypothetical protein